jgi:protein-S-isoprenylcysteine O-methyltransferase Ste14
MKALSDRFQRAPLGIVFLVLFVLVVVIRLLLEAVMLEDGLSLGRAIATVIGSLLFSGVMTLVVARQRRRSGGADTMAEVTASLKTRRLPLDADPATWIPALEWRRRQFRRTMWLMPVLVLVLVAMGVAAVILGSPAGWIIVVVFLALGVVSVEQARRTLPRIDDLLRQLRARDGAGVDQPVSQAGDATRQTPTSPAAGA